MYQNYRLGLNWKLLYLTSLGVIHFCPSVAAISLTKSFPVQGISILLDGGETSCPLILCHITSFSITMRTCMGFESICYFAPSYNKWDTFKIISYMSALKFLSSFWYFGCIRLYRVYFTYGLVLFHKNNFEFCLTSFLGILLLIILNCLELLLILLKTWIILSIFYNLMLLLFYRLYLQTY